MDTMWTNLDDAFALVARTSLYAVAVIAVIILAQMLARRTLSAKWSCALWVVLLLRLAVPVLPESGLSIWNLAPLSWAQHVFSEKKDQGAGQVSVLVITDGLDASAPPSEKEAFPLWLAPRTLLPIIWLAGAMCLMCGIVIGNLRLWDTVRRLPFVTDHALLELFEECRQSMRVQTVVGLVVTDRVKSPILFGFVRPRVLLPAGIVRELPFERLRYIMLHELAHLKRGDILVGWILALLQSLHWFNPLVWWAFGRMRSDRELACDEQVLSHMPEVEHRNYGDVLIGMMERFTHIHRLPAIAGILENKDQLKRRLVMIKKFRRPARREIIAFAVLLAVLSIGLLTEPRPMLSQSKEQGAELREESSPSQEQRPGIKLWPGVAEESNPPQARQAPQVLYNPKPNYTEEARDARVEGTIVLSVTIRDDGRADNVKVERGLGYGLDEAAVRCITEDWRFLPATRDGEPVDHLATIEVVFKLL